MINFASFCEVLKFKHMPSINKELVMKKKYISKHGMGRGHSFEQRSEKKPREKNKTNKLENENVCV